MASPRDRLSNVLGATSLALTDRLLESVRSLPAPADHSSAVAALALLKWVPRMPQGRLSYCLGLSQAATVRLVGRLEAAGLVRRRRFPRRRQIWVESTAEGERVARSFATERQAALRAVVDELSDAEQDLLGALLERLGQALMKSREHVMRVCRLCDTGACGTDDECPMWRAARVLP